MLLERKITAAWQELLCFSFHSHVCLYCWLLFLQQLFGKGMAGVHHGHHLGHSFVCLLTTITNQSTLRTVMRGTSMEVPVSYICFSIPSPIATTETRWMLCNFVTKGWNLSAVVIEPTINAKLVAVMLLANRWVKSSGFLLTISRISVIWLPTTSIILYLSADGSFERTLLHMYTCCHRDRGCSWQVLRVSDIL